MEQVSLLNSSMPKDSQSSRWRVRGMIYAGISVVVVAGLVGIWAPNRRTPEPPSPALQGVDPAIVSSVRDATEAVRKAPRSGEAWGRLATILALHDFGTDAE